MTNDFLDDIPDTDSVEEVVPEIERIPLVEEFDALEHCGIDWDTYKLFRFTHLVISGERYACLEEQIMQNDFSCAPTDIERFWSFVNARSNMFDQQFAGYFVGMLITRLRESGDTTPISVYGCTLEGFGHRARIITYIDVLCDVVGDAFLQSAGCNGGMVKGITINGSVVGNKCLYGAGTGVGIQTNPTPPPHNYVYTPGNVEDIHVLGAVNGNEFLTRAGYDMDDCSVINTGGNIRRVRIDNGVYGTHCFDEVAIGANAPCVFEDININGGVSGALCLTFCGVAGKGVVRNITINGLMRKKTELFEGVYNQNCSFSDITINGTTYATKEELKEYCEG